MVLAASESIFAQTPDNFILRENFNRTSFGNLWKAHPSWSLVNGSALNFIDGTGGTLKTAKSYQDSSYIIVTAAKGFTGSYQREFSITFGQTNLSKEGMYQLKYTAYLGGRLTLSRTSNDLNSPQILDEVAVFPNFNFSGWYTFKIAKYKSGLIQIYVDEGNGYSANPLLEAVDSTYPYLGHFGWQVDTQTSAEEFYLDWVVAHKPYLEKPAIKEKPVEDDLITQVSDNTGKSYRVTKLIAGIKQYTDRDYTVTSVPEYLKGASFIQTANNNKLNTSDSFFTFFIKTSAIVYIAYDSRNAEKPAWLNKWTKTEDRIETSDQNVKYFDIYSKLVENSGELFPYPVVLGGNLAHPALGAKTNYLIAAVKPPASKNYQAEDAELSGAVVAKNHPDYDGTGFADFKNLTKDYIEWTIPINVPGTYNVSFRFANAGAADRILQVSNDGINLRTDTFNVTSSSWSTWSFHAGPRVFLTPGNHKIRLLATGTSGPNIDELSISYFSPSAPVVFPGNYVLNQKVLNQLYDISLKAYPNPFTQNTKIYYEVKEKSNVILTVYTVQGQQIQVLKNGIYNPGKYQAELDGTKFLKGSYYYRLQIGKNVRTGKLIKQ